MEEASDRLRRARKHKGFATARDASRAYGFNKNTYVSHENGNRGLSKDAAERYARAYGVSVGWLLTGENPPPWLASKEADDQRGTLRPVRPIPRLTMTEVATFQRDRLREQLSDCNVFSAIGIDPALGANVFEVVLDDESMAPDFQKGEQVVVDPDQQADPGDYVVATRNGIAIFRRIKIAGYDEVGEPQLELAPLNDAWPPQKVDSETWVVGKVVKHTRDL